jgi:mannose-6-phosphate isomerase-like protein (cupin superfamily)
LSDQSPYSINLDEKFGPLELMDVQTLADQVKEQWHNQTLCRVNDCVIRLGVVQGEFHWHHHDEEDEFFYVVDGRFLVDLEGDRTVELAPKQGFMVPRGVVHRTRASEWTVVLMIEGAGVVPTGDEN